MSSNLASKVEAALVERIVRAVIHGSTQEAADAIVTYREWVRADERERITAGGTP